MKNLDFLITGTGRCGTVYLARLLSSLNISCGHESVFGHKGYEWAKSCLEGNEEIKNSYTSIRDSDEWSKTNDIVAESSYLAAPLLLTDVFRDTKIIHVVRHPVQVVNSFVNYIEYFSSENTEHSEEPKRTYENFIYHHIPELMTPMSQYDRACLYYIKWNRMIESKIKTKESIFHRIEDNAESLLEFIGKKGCVNKLDDKKVNTYEKPAESFCINLIQDRQIKKDFIQIGEDYGYDMSSKYLFI